MRDKFWIAIANFCLRRTSRKYQAFIAGSIAYGLNSAARDIREKNDYPPVWTTSDLVKEGKLPNV